MIRFDNQLACGIHWCTTQQPAGKRKNTRKQDTGHNGTTITVAHRRSDSGPWKGGKTSIIDYNPYYDMMYM